MGYIGKIPSAVPLTSADITDGIIVNADINANAAIESSKLSITSPLSITGNSTAGSEIRLPEDTDNGSNYVALKAANSIASNLTFTLPSADGSANQALITNGSGSLSFATVGATAGQVIQVVTATDQTSRTTTSDTFVTASNTLSVTITPSDSSSRFFICSTGVMNIDTYQNLMTIFRGSTNIGNGDNGMTITSGTITPFAMAIVDSPATSSAITYQVRLRSSAGTTATINYQNSKSTFTVMEIKG